MVTSSSKTSHKLLIFFAASPDKKAAFDRFLVVLRERADGAPPSTPPTSSSHDDDPPTCADGVDDANLVLAAPRTKATSIRCSNDNGGGDGGDGFSFVLGATTGVTPVAHESPVFALGLLFLSAGLV
jgi:hypothetical protein